MDTPATTAEALAPVLFDEFIAYIDRPGQTTRAYINALRQFAAFLRREGIQKPGRADIILYRQYLSAEHDAIQLEPGTEAGWKFRTNRAGNRYKVICKPATVRQYLQAVKLFFSWTQSRGLYPNIAEGIHGPRIRDDVHKKDALRAADVLAIERSITANAQARTAAAQSACKDKAGRATRATEQGKRLKAIYLLATTAGLRTIEISRANVGDLDTREGRAVLWIHGKGSHEADTRKPIAPEVYHAIREYLDTRSDTPTAGSPLFVSTGNRSGGQRMAAGTIGRQLKQAMQAAGYDSERLTAHSLRHTCGTALMELTGDLHGVQAYMRHKDPRTTEIYLHCETERRDAQNAQKLFDYFYRRELKQWE